MTGPKNLPTTDHAVAEEQRGAEHAEAGERHGRPGLAVAGPPSQQR
jgi:hypothetical protein